jgi:hypothetical protein
MIFLALLILIITLIITIITCLLSTYKKQIWEHIKFKGDK